MLRISSVTLTNFRGIREGKVDGLVDVNIVIGRNNSGKSTVAEGITRAAVPWGSSPVFGQRALQTWLRDRHETAPVDDEVRFGGHRDQEAWVEVSFENAATRPISMGMTATPHNSNHVSGRGNVGGAPDCLSFARNIAVFRPPDASDPTIEEHAWERILNVRYDKRIVTSLSTIYGTAVDQLALQPSGRMRILLPQQGRSLDVQGDGMRAAVRSLIMLGGLDKTLFIVEEPESHQHHGALQRFAMALCQQAQSQEVQLFVTTHSLECVNAFLLAAKEASSEAAVFHFEVRDGKLDARRIDAEGALAIEGSGVDLRDLGLYA